MLGAFVAAVVLILIGVPLCIQNWTRGVPWTPRLTLLMATNWCAVLLGLGVGLWWWSRAPANPTGRLLYVAGFCACCEIISRSWPGSLFPYLVGLPGLLTVPCLALIVFGWPTGRPSHRLFRLVVLYGVTVSAIFLVGEVFRKSPEPTPDWPDAPQAIFALPQVWAIMDAFQALALNAVPAVATIIWLIRRRRAVPPAVRPLITPITAAGVLVAGSMVFVHFGFQVFGSLFDGDGDDIGTARLLALLGNYFTVGFVALGVLVAATKRRRAVAVGSRQMLVDLRSARPVVSPSAAAAAIVDDPTAKIRYRGSDGGWIDSSGAALAELDLDRRRLLPIFDEAGREIAGLEVSAATPIPPLLVDLAVSAISARAANERATAQADARRREVRARSRDLVAAADAGRVALERDLHDGAQQLLVGLALTTGLRVRTSASAAELAAASADTIDAIGHVRREVLALVDSATPAALSRGLAAALRSFAAVCPINSSLNATGDVRVGRSPCARPVSGSGRGYHQRRQAFRGQQDRHLPPCPHRGGAAGNQRQWHRRRGRCSAQHRRTGRRTCRQRASRQPGRAGNGAADRGTARRRRTSVNARRLAAPRSGS